MSKKKIIELLLINVAMLACGFYLGLVFLKVNAEPVFTCLEIPYEVIKTEYVEIPVEVEVIKEVVKAETEYIKKPVYIYTQPKEIDSLDKLVELWEAWDFKVYIKSGEFLNHDRDCDDFTLSFQQFCLDEGYLINTQYDFDKGHMLNALAIDGRIYLFEPQTGKYYFKGMLD